MKKCQMWRLDPDIPGLPTFPNQSDDEEKKEMIT